MTTLRRIVTALSVAVLAALPGAPGLAAPKMPKPPLNAPGVLDWSQLSLTPDQIRRINLLRLDFQRLAIRHRADIELRRLEIEKLMMAPNADANRLRTLVREKLELQSKLEFASLENFLAIKKLLTNEQLQRLPAARLFNTP